MPSDLQIESVDRKTLKVQFANATEVTTEQLGKALVDAGQNGYRFSGASLLTSGHQRDPYTVGFSLVLTR